VITYRKAKESDDVAAFIYGAAPELFEYTFSHSALAFLAHDFNRKKGIFGSDWMVVAVSENRPIGTLTMYPGSRVTSLALTTLITILRFYSLIEVFGILKRLLKIAPLFLKPSGDCVFIANGFIHEDYRKPGVFTGLVELAEKRAHEDGLSAIECDISERNTVSLEVHKFLGFTAMCKTDAGDDPRLAGFVRMRLSLNPSESI